MAGYIGLVHKDEGTSYGVSFPDVPGCISAGDTLETALANAGGALAAHLSLMRDDGEAVPAPRSSDKLRQDPEFLAAAADAIVWCHGGGWWSPINSPSIRRKQIMIRCQTRRPPMATTKR
jgi:predicted RNase H-like HicB family nuclease